MTWPAGKADRQVQLQELQTTVSPSGAPKAEWLTLATVWAAVTPVSGREPFAAQQRYAEVDTVFSIRYRSDLAITPLHRLLLGTQVYSIVEALHLPGGRPDHTEIRATARAE